MSLRSALLYAARSTGFFRLSRSLLEGRLPILCLHGFELEDESRFRPKLFMQRYVLRRRLQAVRDADFKVLPLGDALDRLQNGNLPARALSITIDDGFYSVLGVAAPILREFGMPSTLYVTSYYVAKRTPIFGLVVPYMLWKTTRPRLDPSGSPVELPASIDLADPACADAVCRTLIDHGTRHCDEAGRQGICRWLGERLGVDYEAIVESRKLSLLTAQELPRLGESGIDVQLHTHRHRMPMDDAGIARELTDNRSVLEPAVGASLTHFCYPSGQWEPAHWRTLRASGIRSATTCDPGLNARHTPQLALYRTLDANDLPQVVLEAELHGVGDLLRMMTGKRRASDARRRAEAAI